MAAPCRDRRQQLHHGVAGHVPAGHLDHLALTAASPEAFAAIGDRLTQRAASDGAIDDLGAFHSIWFNDPDGMRGEVVLIVDDRLEDIDAPRPLERAT